MLEIPRLIVHLNLEGIDLKKLRAALRLIVALGTQGRRMQVSDKLGRVRIAFHSGVKPCIPLTNDRTLCDPTTVSRASNSS